MLNNRIGQKKVNMDLLSLNYQTNAKISKIYIDAIK